MKVNKNNKKLKFEQEINHKFKNMEHQMKIGKKEVTTHILTQYQLVHDSKSPTRVNATRLFFFGGPWSLSWSSAALVLRPSSTLCGCCCAIFKGPSEPSTLAAGVKGGSCLFFGKMGAGVADIKGGRLTFPEMGVAAGVTWDETLPLEWWVLDEPGW